MKRLTVLAFLLLSSSIACNLVGKDGAPGPAGPPGPGTGGTTTDPGGAASSSSGGAASSSSSGGAASSTSSGGASSTSSSGGTTPPAAATKTGSIMITQSSFQVADTEIDNYTAMAVFTDLTGAPAVDPKTTAKCTTTKEGVCNVTACDATGVQAGNNGGNNDLPPDPKKAPTASDIKITATNDAITLSPDGKGNYSPMTGQTVLYAGGDDIKISAKGADVPAFDKTIKAPAIVNLSTPDWPDAATGFDIDHTADLALGWDNGGEGDVTVMITSSADKKSSIVQCTFKSADGTGTVPAAALAKLVIGDGSISIGSASTLAFDQGGWKLNVTASSPATTTAGPPAAGLAHVK